ncbi:MAG: hypothetical protein ACT4OX_10800 [Actinomycetota bacterium]
MLTDEGIIVVAFVPAGVDLAELGEPPSAVQLTDPLAAEKGGGDTQAMTA